jgi:hypothetical protein
MNQCHGDIITDFVRKAEQRNQTVRNRSEKREKCWIVSEWTDLNTKHTTRLGIIRFGKIPLSHGGVEVSQTNKSNGVRLLVRLLLCLMNGLLKLRMSGKKSYEMDHIIMSGNTGNSIVSPGRDKKSTQ